MQKSRLYELFLQKELILVDIHLDQLQGNQVIHTAGNWQELSKEDHRRRKRRETLSFQRCQDTRVRSPSYFFSAMVKILNGHGKRSLTDSIPRGSKRTHQGLVVLHTF